MKYVEDYSVSSCVLMMCPYCDSENVRDSAYLNKLVDGDIEESGHEGMTSEGLVLTCRECQAEYTVIFCSGARIDPEVTKDAWRAVIEEINFLEHIEVVKHSSAVDDVLKAIKYLINPKKKRGGRPKGSTNKNKGDKNGKQGIPESSESKKVTAPEVNDDNGLGAY